MAASWLTDRIPKTLASHSYNSATMIEWERFFGIFVMRSPSMSSSRWLSHSPLAASASHSVRIHRFLGGSGGADRIGVSVTIVGMSLPFL